MPKKNNKKPVVKTKAMARKTFNEDTSHTLGRIEEQIDNIIENTNEKTTTIVDRINRFETSTTAAMKQHEDLDVTRFAVIDKKVESNALSIENKFSVIEKKIDGIESKIDTIIEREAFVKGGWKISGVIVTALISVGAIFSQLFGGLIHFGK